MITGAQIRAARRLLGWETQKLARQSGVSLAAIIRAEAADGEPAITLAHNSAVQRALEKAGVEFTGKADDELGVRRSNGQSHADSARARAD